MQTCHDEKMRGYLLELMAASRSAGSVLALYQLAKTPEEQWRWSSEALNAEDMQIRSFSLVTKQLGVESERLEAMRADRCAWQVRAQRAEAACQRLVDAYQEGMDNGGSVDWGDVDEAHALARSALGLDDGEGGQG